MARKPKNGAKAMPPQWPPWALQLLAVDDNLHTLTNQLDVAADAAALNDCSALETTLRELSKFTYDVGMNLEQVTNLAVQS